jgi:simple sugar transport system permease protein
MVYSLGHWLSSDLVQGFLGASIRLSIPLLLAALGGVFAERSGVMNIGMEGMMLGGALAGYSVAAAANNVVAGAMAALAMGALIGVVLGFFTITLPCDQVIAGLSLNLLAAAATSYLFRLFYGSGISTPSPPQFTPVAIPLLSRIPYIGGPLFHQDAVTYVAFLLVPVAWIVIRKTAWGIQVEAVGENPSAAETLGVEVNRTRYSGLVISATLSGLAGAFLTLVESPTWLDGLTNGRGYIALAILIVGRRQPFGVLLGALLFGAADALQLRTQLLPISIPFQFMLMLPYILTMVALAGFVRRPHVPASLGIPYRSQR